MPTRLLAGVVVWCMAATPPLGLSCRGCPMLTELRLNHNQIHALPAELASNTRLRILDIGGNPIASFDDIQVGRVVC